MSFQNDIQIKIFLWSSTNCSQKNSMFKKEMICMAGYVLIRHNLFYDSTLHDLVFLLVYSKPAHR